MKVAFMEAFLPGLKGSKANQTGTGKGANSKAAISRAVGDMLKKVKGKRISMINAQITLMTQ